MMYRLAGWIITGWLLASPLQAQLIRTAISEHIAKHPEKSSIVVLVNEDTVIASSNREALPLPGLAHWFISLEYARRIGNHTLDPSEMVSLDSLRALYIPNTDAGAFENWQKYMHENGLVKDEKVALRDIVTAMIEFSDNASMEYLMERLTPDSLNRMAEDLGVKLTVPLYYYASAILLSSMYDERSYKNLDLMSNEEYAWMSKQLHYQIKTDSILRKSVADKELPLSFQEIWTNHHPKATALNMASVLKKVNDGNYFPAEMQAELELIWGGILNYSQVKDQLVKLGVKTGATRSILNSSVYGTTATGDRIVLVYMIGGINLDTNLGLSYTMVSFEDAVLTDPEFRKGLIYQFAD